MGILHLIIYIHRGIDLSFLNSATGMLQNSYKVWIIVGNLKTWNEFYTCMICTETFLFRHLHLYCILCNFVFTENCRTMESLPYQKTILRDWTIWPSCKYSLMSTSVFIGTRFSLCLSVSYLRFGYRGSEIEVQRRNML